MSEDFEDVRSYNLDKDTLEQLLDEQTELTADAPASPRHRRLDRPAAFLGQIRIPDLELEGGQVWTVDVELLGGRVAGRGDQRLVQCGPLAGALKPVPGEDRPRVGGLGVSRRAHG